VTELPPSLHRYRRELERAVAADRARRRRRRAGAVAAAVVVAIVVANLLPAGGERRAGVAPASAVERAARVLQPRAGRILHVHVVGRQFQDGRADLRWQHEAWTLAGTNENRTVQTPPEGPVVETAYADGVASLWDAKAGRVVEKPAPQDEGVGTPDGGFRAEALAMLRSQRTTVTRQTRGGRDVLRITGGGTKFYVIDARTYTPLELGTRGSGGGTMMRFVTYEWLPLTEQGERLLSIEAQHPGAPVVRDAATYDAVQRELFPLG
jgi:hypothetical protein